MKRDIKIDEKIYTETLCDTCGENLDMCNVCDVILNSPPIALKYNYTTYDFCNEECTIIFLIEELKKQKDTRKEK